MDVSTIKPIIDGILVFIYFHDISLAIIVLIIIHLIHFFRHK